MAILLSDVGGTNARLALSRSGSIDAATVSRYRGDDFASYDDVIRRYLDEQGSPRIEAVCIAVAGPVASGAAQLTNRDWDFSEDRLIALTGAGRALIINDLVALGHAMAGPQGRATELLRDTSGLRARNGQSVVVNAGTGFNICVVCQPRQGRAVCMESEEGHTRLPEPVLRMLKQAVGDDIADFSSLEELFAGRGLARLHGRLSGHPVARAEDVTTAAAEGDARAGATLDLYTAMLGLACREFALRYLPLDGMYLAGSVARTAAARFDLFERNLLADGLMRDIPQAVPVRVIRDDMAALHGCLAAIL